MSKQESPCKYCTSPKPCQDPKNCEKRLAYLEEFRDIGVPAVDIDGSYRFLPK